MLMALNWVIKPGVNRGANKVGFSKESGGCRGEQNHMAIPNIS